MENNKFMKVKLRRKREIEGISLFHYVSRGENPQKYILHELVYAFKGINYTNSLFKEYLAEKIERYLPIMFNCDKKDLVILCVPSSKKETTVLRYKSFCEKLNSLGIEADYETLYLDSDVETKHLRMYSMNMDNRNLKSFKESIRVNYAKADKLRGKRVVLLDDVITNGKNIESCFELLRSSLGIKSTFLTLGRTYNENYENENSSTIYEYMGNADKFMKDLIAYVDSNIKKVI